MEGKRGSGRPRGRWELGEDWAAYRGIIREGTSHRET